MTLPERGPFSFPAPWGTIGIRITNGNDMGGRDALWYCGYTYWRNMNAHQGQSHLKIFLGIDRNRGGGGPSLWTVDKGTDAVTFQGPLFGLDHPLSWQTGEGWYWSASRADVLYCADDRHLYRYHVDTRAIETVVDMAGLSPAVAWIARQWHSSDDDRVHTATVRHPQTYAKTGTLVYTEGAASPWAFHPARGALDESQVDPSGQWVLIKDNVDQVAGEDNIILDLYGQFPERVILDEHGAAGHSDSGYGYMVAADNYHALPNAIRLWQFDPHGDPQGQVVYHGANWDSDLTHVSHQNAQPAPARLHWVVGSSASAKYAPRNNEVVGFRLDGALECVSIAPVLTDLSAPGGGDQYARLPKGNLDRTGSYFLWTTNLGGARLDALVVKVPTQLLGGHGGGNGSGCTHACPVHCPTCHSACPVHCPPPA